MMSLDTMHEMAAEAATIAASEDLIPFVIWEKDLKSIPPFPFPFLGTFVPDGWEVVEEFFVDSSGFGAENEPALTTRAFLAIIRERCSTDIDTGWGILSAGQFQVTVGRFNPVK